MDEDTGRQAIGVPLDRTMTLPLNRNLPQSLYERIFSFIGLPGTVVDLKSEWDRIQRVLLIQLEKSTGASGIDCLTYRSLFVVGSYVREPAAWVG